MDERKVKRIYHPPAVPAADLFKGGKQRRVAAYEALLDRRKQMEATAITFSGILFRLAELPQIPMEFNETLWHTLVDHVTVYNDERIVFTFTDGTEIVTML